MKITITKDAAKELGITDLVITKREQDFLRESNAIEQVYDDDSLQQALYAWKVLASKNVLTTGLILRVHKILMLHQPLRPDEKGYWRRCQVWIGNREAPRWEKMVVMMGSWILDANRSDEEETIKKDHILFEYVHPFVDGNGRVGRMLMNWQRVNSGLPILVIKEKEKQDYYLWFDQR